jgi:hypothetical protein
MRWLASPAHNAGAPAATACDTDPLYPLAQAPRASAKVGLRAGYPAKRRQQSVGRIDEWDACQIGISMIWDGPAPNRSDTCAISSRVPPSNGPVHFGSNRINVSVRLPLSNTFIT